VGLVLFDETLLLEQGIQDAFDRVRRPERLLEPSASPLRRDDGELSGPDLGDAALVEHERDARREERFADDESASPADLDHNPVGQLVP
jgi:hypothetical protein